MTKLTGEPIPRSAATTPDTVVLVAPPDLCEVCRAVKKGTGEILSLVEEIANGAMVVMCEDCLKALDEWEGAK